MRSRLLLLLATVIFSATVAANCAVTPTRVGRIRVESCEIIDTVNHPYVGPIARRLSLDESARKVFLETYTGVIIHTADDAFFFKDASQTACDAFATGGIIRATIERECCDGGGGAPCGLGFDAYITEYEEEQ